MFSLYCLVCLIIALTTMQVCTPFIQPRVHPFYFIRDRGGGGGERGEFDFGWCPSYNDVSSCVRATRACSVALYISMKLSCITFQIVQYLIETVLAILI